MNHTNHRAYVSAKRVNKKVTAQAQKMMKSLQPMKMLWLLQLSLHFPKPSSQLLLLSPLPSFLLSPLISQFP
jgi:hypothetical protein